MEPDMQMLQEMQREMQRIQDQLGKRSSPARRAMVS